MNWETGSQQFYRAYFNLFSQTGMAGHPYGGSILMPADFKVGNTIFLFDLTPDGVTGTCNQQLLSHNSITLFLFLQAIIYK
jgi:hypothetical protein